MRIGEQMVASFKKSLPEGFHGKISSPVKTMEKLKQGIKVGDKTVFNLDAIFLCLLLVGQQRQLQLDTVFQHELCAVPSSLCDEYSCQRKGNKAVLVKHLVPLREVQTPDMVIVDTQQLMYNMAPGWQCISSCWKHETPPRKIPTWLRQAPRLRQIPWHLCQRPWENEASWRRIHQL